jgi:hypothetical protein
MAIALMLTSPIVLIISRRRKDHSGARGEHWGACPSTTTASTTTKALNKQSAPTDFHQNGESSELAIQVSRGISTNEKQRGNDRCHTYWNVREQQFSRDDSTEERSDAEPMGVSTAPFDD